MKALTVQQPWAWAATEISCATGDDFGFVPGSLPTCRALCDWLRKHGLDPDNMPRENLITRCLAERQVCAVVFVIDETGRKRLDPTTGDAETATVLVQLEAPPLPWPADVWEATDA